MYEAIAAAPAGVTGLLRQILEGWWIPHDPIGVLHVVAQAVGG